MAPCCSNTVTPRMIKAGHVSIGDKIQLDDVPVSSENLAGEAEQPEEKKEEYIPVQSPNLESVGSMPEGVQFQPAANNNMNQQAPYTSGQTQSRQYQTSNSSVNASNSNAYRLDPLPYSQMTSYMNNVSLRGSTDSPSMVTPQDPMTPNGFEEEIDYESIQAFNGFLRTQIGRYMRIEQLIGSNTIEDRFGFLVGVGTNFIILQEITTGNIMVIDIFSIRLTYVYYSPPVIPNI